MHSMAFRSEFSRCANSEADEFYATVIPTIFPMTRRTSCGKASPGCCGRSSFITTWSSSGWTAIPADPPPPAERKNGRNHDWAHLYNADVISMPDKWEYPWYAAWDLAFHCVPLALVDPDFAKEQLMLHAARMVHASQRADSRL